MQRLFSFAFITTVALKSFENKDWAKNGGGGERERIGDEKRKSAHHEDTRKDGNKCASIEEKIILSSSV